MSRGLYIHIPFCASKCAYCDFLSFEGTEEALQKRYVGALKREISASCKEIFYDTVYIGGGTPTALPSPLLSSLFSGDWRFNLTDDVEITVEMNPCITSQGTVCNSTGIPLKVSPWAAMKALIFDLKVWGVNRLSIGLQAWQDELLERIGRPHKARDFVATIKEARAVGIDNINVDLMFGLPGQTVEHWRETIAHVLSYGPEHISAYSLTPAENTPLWDKLETGETRLPDDATDRAMYHEAITLLSAAGYRHYELSNFALPGRESRHNVNCWLRRPYIGCGLGAHSFDGASRWHNPSDMERYLEGGENHYSHRQFRQNDGKFPCDMVEDYHVLSTQDAMAETMFLGLRMTDGVNPSDFYNQFGKSLTEAYGTEIERLLSQGLLLYKNENIALTPLGLDLANQVFGAFL